MLLPATAGEAFSAPMREPCRTAVDASAMLSARRGVYARGVAYDGGRRPGIMAGRVFAGVHTV